MASQARLALSKRSMRGQGLIEVIIAIAILVIALTAVMALAANNIAVGRESELRLIGSNLAREGVEVARNIRDTNRLKVGAGLLGADQILDVGLESGTDYTAIAVFDPSANSWALNFTPNLITDASARIYFLSSLYRQATTQPGGSIITPFRRLLTLNEICKDPKLACSDATDVNGFICEAGQSCAEKIGIQILSEVRWTVRGRESRTLVEDRIYKW